MRDHKEPTLPTQLVLHGVAEIAHEMKAIGDLTRLGCAAAHAVGIRPMPIAADDPNRGMRLQPRGDRIRGADREHIDHACAATIRSAACRQLDLPLRVGRPAVPSL